MSPPEIQRAAIFMVGIIMARVKHRADHDQARGLTPRESITAITEEMLSRPSAHEPPDDRKVTHEDLVRLLLMDYYSGLLEQGVPKKFSNFLCAPLFAKLEKVLVETHFYRLDGA